MASKGPEDRKPGERAASQSPVTGNDDLERRRKALGAELSARGVGRKDEIEARQGGGGATGYGQALRLSSEFIAGIAVGAGLGWFVDRLAGTSPFGLIVFLLLGFGAGVLNVLRSAGMVAEPGPKRTDASGGDDERN